MKISIIIGVLLALGGLAALIYFKGWKREKTDYQPVKVTRADLKASVATTGTVKPQTRVEIKPPLSGRIEEVFVAEGKTARKGDTLAIMSSTDRAILLDTARSRGKDELARWEQIYKPMPVVAPIDGDIIARNVEPGQTVTANEILFSMADRLIVQAQIDETDIGSIKIGQTAELNLDAYPTNTILGRVDSIAYDAKIVNNVTMYLVDILPEQVPLFMRSGMTANIQVITAMTNNVLVLPTAAVHTEGKSTVVWRPNPANAARPVTARIVTGLSDGKKIEIVSGLDEGDRVLTSHASIPASKPAAVNPFNPFRRRAR